ncbi:TPA: dihydrofolate reductase [Streptococcus suis]
MLIFIYAQDNQGTIGNKGRLPWHIPEEMAFFKAQTMGHAILMGRKTFEGMNQVLLSGRKTYVMTRDPHYGQEIKGLGVIHDRGQVLSMAEEEDIFVIGGAEVFNLFWDQVDLIIKTQIDGLYQGDVFMPPIDQKVFSREKVIDGKGPIKHQFEWWRRIKGEA